MANSTAYSLLALMSPNVGNDLEKHVVKQDLNETNRIRSATMASPKLGPSYETEVLGSNL